MTLESLVLCRDAFARGEPAAVTAAVLATARRLFLQTWRVELLAVNAPMPQAASRVDKDSSALPFRSRPWLRRRA
jgi:hypothetical protein